MTDKETKELEQLKADLLASQEETADAKKLLEGSQKDVADAKKETAAAKKGAKASMEKTDDIKGLIPVRVVKNLIGACLGLLPHKDRVEFIDKDLLEEFPLAFVEYKGNVIPAHIKGTYKMDLEGILKERDAKKKALKRAKEKRNKRRGK